MAVASRVDCCGREKFGIVRCCVRVYESGLCSFAPITPASSTRVLTGSIDTQPATTTADEARAALAGCMGLRKGLTTPPR